MAARAQALLDLVAAHPGHVLAPYILSELHAAAISHGDGAMAERARSALLAYPGHPAMQRVLFDIGADRISAILPYSVDGGYPWQVSPDVAAIILTEVDRIETWARRYNLPVTANRLMESADQTLSICGREDIVLAHWPAQDRQRASALFETGHPAEAIRDWSYLFGIQSNCLYAQARYAELATLSREGRLSAMQATNDLAGLRREQPHDESTGERMISAGLAADVINDPAFPAEARGWALLATGRPADALRLAPAMGSLEIACQLAQGHEDDALKHHGDIFVPYRIAITHWLRGDHQTAHELVAQARFATRPVYMFMDEVSAYYLVPALMSLSAGDAASARAQVVASLAPTAHSNGLQYWHIAAYACGQEDEAAFRAQQWQQGLENRFHLAEGLRADLAGETAKARAAYTAFLAVDFSLDSIDFVRLIAHWRIAELSGPTR